MPRRMSGGGCEAELSRQEKDECIMEVKTTQKKTTLWKRLANAQASVNACQRPRRGIKSKRRADEPFQMPNGQKHLLCTKTPSNRQKEKYQNSRTSSRANGSERGGHGREKGVTDRKGKKKKRTRDAFAVPGHKRS